MNDLRRWLWILGFLLLILPAVSIIYGQVKVEATNRAVGSVTITAGVDPQSARSIMSETGLQAALPALPYSAMVTNSGTSTAVLFVVRFEFRRLDGEISSVSVQVRDYRSTEPKLRPGASQVVDPTGWLARYQLPAYAAASNVDSRYSEFLAQVSKIKSLSLMRVSLDAVLLDNGCFAGPDTAGTFAALVDERSALGSLFNTLKAMANATDSEVAARLEDVATAAQNQAKAAKTVDSSRVQLRVAQNAEFLKATLQNGGRMAFSQAVAAYNEPVLWKEAGR